MQPAANTLDQLLRDLANQMGTTVDALWPIWVKYVFTSKAIEFYSFMAALFLFTTIGIFLNRHGYRFFMGENPKYSDGDKGIGFIIAGWIVLCFAFIFLAGALNALTGYLCPEAKALELLLDKM